MAAIEGLDEVLAKLKGLQNTDLTPVYERACLIVENEAKRNCPVDSGTLRNSITHEATASQGVVGTNLEYAPYVEYGTGIFSSLGNGRQDVPWKYKDAEGEWHTTKGQKPQPFLIPALDNNKAAIKKLFTEMLQEAIDD